MADVFFITGSTGNIGGRLVSELLLKSDCRLILLITGTSLKHAHAKKDDVLSFWQVNETLARQRIDVFHGDITRDKLGLSQQDYDRVSREVTQIVHCAANLKLNLTLAEARQSILNGTKNVVGLAESCQKIGQFKRFHYISTLEISGQLRGIFKEEFLDTANHRFLNTYEQVKAETEEFLRQKNVNEQFPLTIYRPSMVVGDSKSGRIRNFQSFYYLLRDMVIAPTSPVLPMSKNFRVELAPVDFVAEFIVAVSKTGEETDGKIYHLTNGGPGNLTSLPEFIDIARRTLKQLTGQSLSKQIFISPVVLIYLLSVVRLFCIGKIRKFVENQLIFLQFFLLDVVFDNQQMKRFAQSHQLVVPTLKNCLVPLCQYYISQGNSKEKHLA